MNFADAYNMPIHRRKWWIRKINDVIDKQNQQQNEVVRMPQPAGGAQRSMRAREVGR